MSFRACAPADEVACAESERRLLTWAIDWTRQVADMEDAISSSDKVGTSGNSDCAWIVLNS